MVSAPTSTRVEAYGSAEAGHTVEASTSGIAWPPILGGAFAAAATAAAALGGRHRDEDWRGRPGLVR
jgi:hypothetical protein